MLRHLAGAIIRETEDQLFLSFNSKSSCLFVFQIATMQNNTFTLKKDLLSDVKVNQVFNIVYLLMQLTEIHAGMLSALTVSFPAGDSTSVID